MKVRQVRSQWSGTLLVCAKCSKKIGGGFGPEGKTSLAKALRKHCGLKKGRKAPFGIVEVKCLGLCPKGAVTVVDGAQPENWMLVREGSAVEEVAAELALVGDKGH